jgi:hypothetical protein
MDLAKCGGTCRSNCQHYAIGVDCGDEVYQQAKILHCYRWLENGEAFQKGDEFAGFKKLTGEHYLPADPNDDIAAWMRVTRFDIGKIYYDHEYKGTRRKVDISAE